MREKDDTTVDKPVAKKLAASFLDMLKNESRPTDIKDFLNCKPSLHWLQIQNTTRH